MLSEKVSVARLRGITIYTKDDLYDFAKLWLRVTRAREAGEQNGNSRCISYLSVHGMVADFTRMMSSWRPETERAIGIVRRAGLDPNDLVVDEGEAEAIRKEIEELSDRISRSPVHVFLTGVPCVGKTAIGTRLANNFKIPFIELDARIAKKTGDQITAVGSMLVSDEEFCKSIAIPELSSIIKSGSSDSFVLELPASGLMQPIRGVLKADKTAFVVALVDSAENIIKSVASPSPSSFSFKDRQAMVSFLNEGIREYEKSYKQTWFRFDVEGASPDRATAVLLQRMARCQGLIGRCLDVRRRGKRRTA